MVTLYSKLTALDNYGDQLGTVGGQLQTLSLDQAIPDFNKFQESSKLSVLQRQNMIIEEYESNPFLSSALKDEQTLEESLKDLNDPNRWFRQILPRRNDPDYNQKVGEMGELIDKPNSLKTHNFFYPDNFVNGLIYGAGTTAAFSYLITRFMIDFDPSTAPEAIQESKQVLFYISAGLTSLVGIAFGIGATIERSHRPPIKQAQYLDTKINQLK